MFRIPAFIRNRHTGAGLKQRYCVSTPVAWLLTENERPLQPREDALARSREQGSEGVVLDRAYISPPVAIPLTRERNADIPKYRMMSIRPPTNSQRPVWARSELPSAVR